jgi:transketolase
MTQLSSAERDELVRTAAQIRLDVVRMIGPDNRGHFGGSMSVADIVAVLYFKVMNIDPGNPGLPGRDRFILSKGHSCPAQYAALARKGFFPVSELATLKEVGSRLQGHPDRSKLPGIEANTGSLGQGLSQGIGMALALKADGLPSTVYVVLGDGELNEGQVWEAVLFAGARKLNNLIAVVDRNRLQAMGATRDRLDCGEPGPKFAAFGWEVLHADGHDVEALAEAFETARGKDRPVAIIAETVKGKGLPFAENQVGFHNGLLTREQYDRAVSELTQRIGGGR